MKTRHRTKKITLSIDEYDDLVRIQERYAKDVSLSGFCREILAGMRIHPYNYINANLLDKPVGIEDKGPLKNNMEQRYHVKGRLVATLILLLDQKNTVTDAIAENEPLYNELIDYFRGYTFNPESGKKEYQDKPEISSPKTKRIKTISIRVSHLEDNNIMQCYCTGPQSYMSFVEWARQVLLGKIKQSKFSTYYETMYEIHREKFFNEPVVPGFQTYLHYESQAIAALIMVLNYNSNVKNLLEEKAEQFQLLTETMWGYSFDQSTKLKRPLDLKHLDQLDRVINAQYYQIKENKRPWKKVNRPEFASDFNE